MRTVPVLAEEAHTRAISPIPKTKSSIIAALNDARGVAGEPLLDADGDPIPGTAAPATGVADSGPELPDDDPNHGEEPKPEEQANGDGGDEPDEQEPEPSPAMPEWAQDYYDRGEFVDVLFPNDSRELAAITAANADGLMDLVCFAPSRTYHRSNCPAASSYLDTGGNIVWAPIGWTRDD